MSSRFVPHHQAQSGRVTRIGTSRGGKGIAANPRPSVCDVVAANVRYWAELGHTRATEPSRFLPQVATKLGSQAQC